MRTRLNQVRDRLRNITGGLGRPSSSAPYNSRPDENMSVSDTSQHSGSQQQPPPAPHNPGQASGGRDMIMGPGHQESKDSREPGSMDIERQANGSSHRSSRKRMPIVNNPDGETLFQCLGTSVFSVPLASAKCLFLPQSHDWCCYSYVHQASREAFIHCRCT